MKLENTLENTLNKLIDAISARFAETLFGKLNNGKGKLVRRIAAAPVKSVKSKPGRKGSVKCKVPACKKASKGPRFHFLCSEHRDFGNGALRNLGVKV